jgi:ribosomal protein L12E/L44/L45/RPP1/RPP2
MAREIVYTDDLDGTHGAEPVKFGWDDIWWEIDLAEANRKKLHEALQPFLDKAQPATVAAAKAEAPKRQRAARAEGGKIDYSSPEHAGKPHRGRVTEAEAAYVREHFDEVNTRLSSEGLRTLDRADPKVKERYGL